MHKRQPWRYDGKREIEYEPWKKLGLHVLISLIIFFLLFLFFYWLISTGSADVQGWSTMLTVNFSVIFAFLFTLDAFLCNLDEIIVRTIIKRYALKIIKEKENK